MMALWLASQEQGAELGKDNAFSRGPLVLREGFFFCGFKQFKDKKMAALIGRRSRW